MMVIDDSQILVHNGMGHQFTHGPNALFQQRTLADAKQLFMSALSDTNQIGACKTSTGVDGVSPDEEDKIDIPDEFDWRKEYSHCV